MKYTRKRHKKRGIKLTVCIAATCSFGSIICISDRMLTQEDVGYEPDQSKIKKITNAIVLLTAGDSSTQDQIIIRLNQWIKQRIEKAPKTWINIADVVEKYVFYHNDIKTERAEAEFLSPFGLNRETFIQHQRKMERHFIERLSTDISNYSLPDVGAIIAGIDSTGPHIWTAQIDFLGDKKAWAIDCHDTVGYAAIGAGKRHADSEMMFAGHSPLKTLPETLFSVYWAKKRAEATPEVGRATDMCMIGPPIGRIFDIKTTDLVFREIETVYKKTKVSLERSKKAATESIKEKILSLSKKPEEPKQDTPPKESP